MTERIRLIESLKIESNWDIIVIGGGATGLGIAVDSVSRGYKTLLLEQEDFAKGTSSKSTKLVHGGVRYLAQGNIGLVREALRERGILLKNAPHLVKKQSFIIPIYSWFDAFFYTIGMKIYDFLSGKLGFGRSIFLSRDIMESQLEVLDNKNLKGGVLYYDGQFDDSRLAVNLAQTSIKLGASILNHFKVTALLKSQASTVVGVKAKDMETGKVYEIFGKNIVNATGVFADDVLKMDDKHATKTIRPSQGVHLVLDSKHLPGNKAIMIPNTDDGRIIFFVPWHDRVLIGTTDTPLDEYQLEPMAMDKEIEFLLNTANEYLKSKIKRSDILSIFAGLRPLAVPKNGSKNSKEISRSHKIFISDSGLINIIGGKWTTYRKMAEDVIDHMIETGGLEPKKCTTAELRVHGWESKQDGPKRFSHYGSDSLNIENLLEINPELREKLHPDLPFVKAEVVWAIRHEMARTVEDVLARRVRALFINARASLEAAPVVAEIIAQEIGHDTIWEELQTRMYRQLASKYLLEEPS